MAISDEEEAELAAAVSSLECDSPGAQACPLQQAILVDASPSSARTTATADPSRPQQAPDAVASEFSQQQHQFVQHQPASNQLEFQHYFIATASNPYENFYNQNHLHHHQHHQQQQHLSTNCDNFNHHGPQTIDQAYPTVQGFSDHYQLHEQIAQQHQQQHSYAESQAKDADQTSRGYLLPRRRFKKSTNKAQHNEIERRRRSRMKCCCEELRLLVPGIGNRTDKASILEHTVRYIKQINEWRLSTLGPCQCNFAINSRIGPSDLVMDNCVQGSDR